MLEIIQWKPKDTYGGIRVKQRVATDTEDEGEEEMQPRNWSGAATLQVMSVDARAGGVKKCIPHRSFWGENGPDSLLMLVQW